MQSTSDIRLLIALAISCFCLALMISGIIMLQTSVPWDIVTRQAWAVSPYTLVFSIFCTLGLGLPAAAFLRSRNWLGVFPCAIAGTLAGAVPASVFGIFFILDASKVDQNGALMIANGMPTVTGLMVYAQIVAVPGAIGLACGMTFWGAFRIMTLKPAST